MSNTSPGTTLPRPVSPGSRKIIEALACVPRRIPREIREEMASIMVMELLEGVPLHIRDSKKFIERYGIFYPILIHLHHTDLWRTIREVADESPGTAEPLAASCAGKILDLVERFPVPGDALYDDLDSVIRYLLAIYGDFPGDPEQPASLHCQTPQDALMALLTRLSDLLGRSDQEPDPETLNQLTDLLAEIRDELEKTGFDQDIDDVSRLQDKMEELAGLPEKNPEDAGTPRRDQTDEHPDSTPQESGTPPGGSEDAAERSESGTPAQGSGNGAGSDTLASLMQQARTLLDELKQQPGPANPGELTRIPGERLGDLLQKSVVEPLHTDLRSLRSRQNTIRYLSHILPEKDWGLDITSLKEEEAGKVEQIARCIGNSPELKGILKLFGRVRTDYGMKSPSLSPMGCSEMYSITRSGDISRLLPAETVLLQHPVLRKKFFADFTEGNLLTYQLQGQNRAGGRPVRRKKGPVVVLIDTSGSMTGFPELVAKSITLAISKKMTKQERDLKVILFSGPGNTREIELISGKRNASAIMKFLQGTFKGGTDFNTALRTGLETIQEDPVFTGADLLFITDGVSEISNRMVLAEWNRVKDERDARVFSFIVGSGDAGGLSLISDYIYFIENAGEPVESGKSRAVMRFIPSPDNPPK